MEVAGGKGGNANSTEIRNNGTNLEKLGKDGSDPRFNTNSGFDGESGENCGVVNILDGIQVYAYGGAGGSRRRRIDL